MPIRVLPTLSIVAAWLGVAVAVAQSQAPAAPSTEDRLATKGLTHEARSLGHRRADSDVARAGRIMALLRYAHRLCPSDVQTNRQLVDLYEGVGDLKRAAAAAKVCIEAHPRDYACGVRWIRLTLATLNTAEQRIGFLKVVVAEKKLSRGIRAVAAAELCRIYQGQGAVKDARGTCEQALRLDAYEPTALEMRGKLTKRTAPAYSFDTTLAVFCGNPRSLHTARRLAQLLQNAAVYDKALLFYEHAYALAETARPADRLMEALLIDYFNAMLDAGMVEKAVAFFAPLIEKRYGRSLALRALMVEACRSLGDNEKAAVHVEAMARIYRPLAAPGARRRADQAAELAWFNLIFRSRPKLAIQWAKEAALSAGDDPFVQRVLAKAELAMGEADSGRKRLAGLVGKDQYAAAILAENYYQQGNPAEGQKVLLKGAGLIRTGPAWRALAAVAAGQKVNLPTLPHADLMRSALAKVPAHVFAMGRYPEQFIRAELTVAKDKVAIGEPLAVTVVIENISQHPVPLGQWGLFNPVVFLSVTVEGPVNAQRPVEANLPSLTLATLPVPKYLGPGQKVSRTVRVDVGRAEELLMAYPAAELKLTVSAMLDPLQKAEKMFSSVPGIKIAPVVIRRAALFDVSGGEKSAQYALGYIVRDLKQGSPAVLVRAARQTASLLGRVRKAEFGKAKPILPDVLTKPVLLSMTKAFLEAPSPVVRAEMLAALRHVDLDAQIISLMGPCIQDAVPLVRMRLIELLAAKRTRDYKTLLTYFAADSNDLVREMTSALAGQK